VQYEDFDVVLPTPSPKTNTPTTPARDVSGSKMASSPAEALAAFNRLSDQEKTKVLDYIRAAYVPKAVQETEGEELPGWIMLAMFCLLMFTFCAYVSWIVSSSSTQ
jgi:hypothetical protein